MRLLAPAKINLHLRVGPRDQSGFHPLMSWFVTVGLFDTLTMRRSDRPGIRLSCDWPNLPVDSRNLVFRAADMMLREVADRIGRDLSPCPGIEIELHKRIPVSAGLGGGSSDAARTLIGLDHLWELNLGMRRLHDLAAGLGSDVPFFLHGPSSICTGRGEVVQPMQRPRAKWALLIFPNFALPTAAVYAKFDELRLGNTGFADEPPGPDWTALSAEALLERLVNDLEPAAFALNPELGELRNSLERSLWRVIRMTGSGSALFTLFDDRDAAGRAAQIVQATIAHAQHSPRAVVAELAPHLDDDLIAS